MIGRGISQVSTSSTIPNFIVTFTNLVLLYSLSNSFLHFISECTDFAVGTSRRVGSKEIYLSALEILQNCEICTLILLLRLVFRFLSKLDDMGTGTSIRP